MQIHRLKSAHPISPYAPEWNIPIGIDQWTEFEKIDTIKDFLLSKEEEILKLDILDDARTGLGENDVTTRYGHYNLFDFANECPEIGDLLNFLRTSWFDFIRQDSTTPYPLNIICWYNIIRKGQEIKLHRHSADETTYLSGNMHLDSYDTLTTYEHMEMDMAVPNVKGGVTFFPGYVEHYVPIYEGDTPRVSLAFDLYIHLPPMFSARNDLKHLMFINNELMQRLTGGGNFRWLT